MGSNKYQFTVSAIKDLDEILNYISINLSNDIAAKKFYDAVLDIIEKICEFPNLYPKINNE